MVALLSTQISTFFFAATNPCDHTFFFLPTWWEYLKTSPDCSVQFSFPNDLLAVGLAIVDILLRVAGLVAIVSIIAAGVGYMTASGDVQKTASASKRIYNALIGLAIVSVSSGFVAFIGNKLG
ncbi:hypothetical protein BVY00_00980 [bacterium G20]|nr:hypothetical protein BVY00_00980 [bacterium G20]